MTDPTVCVCWRPVTPDEMCGCDNPTCVSCHDRYCLDPRDSRPGTPRSNR